VLPLSDGPFCLWMLLQLVFLALARTVARPRDITSPQFNQTKRHILDLLRSERANQPLETMDHQ